MPPLRARREAVAEAALRPRFTPVARVVRFAPLFLAAVLRGRLATLLRARLTFAPARERVVLAFPRVERAFEAVADLARPPVFLRAPAFAAGRPRFAAPRFAPAFAPFFARVPLAALRVPAALRPRVPPVLARRPRAPLERLPRLLCPSDDCPSEPASVSSIMES